MILDTLDLWMDDTGTSPIELREILTGMVNREVTYQMMWNYANRTSIPNDVYSAMILVVFDYVVANKLGPYALTAAEIDWTDV
jgi:hypothetical protein